MSTYHPKILFQWQGTVSRGPFAFWGILLFLLKYSVDRLLSYEYRDEFWNFVDYFKHPDEILVNGIPENEQMFNFWIVMTAIPFIGAGTLLTVKRLRDTGLKSGLVALFFLPFVNLFFFLILCLLPSRSSDPDVKAATKAWLDRMIPKSKLGAAAVSGVLTCLIAVPIMILSIYNLETYGLGLFLGIPFMLGLSASLLYAHHQYRTFWQMMGVSASSILLFTGVLFFAALEGALCLIMAAPIGLLLGAIGGFIGFLIQGPATSRNGSLQTSLWIILPLFLVLEAKTYGETPLIAVKTSVEVDAPAQAVWDELVAFSEIDEPTDWLFHTGIAYPKVAEIHGHGVGAVRHCVFTTGPFIEPIEVWDEPYLLKFSVEDQPPPMVEMSLYNDLHMPHLENYFGSEQGQFLLTDLPNGRTHLEGTTWYRHSIWPTSYWVNWSDWILHRIHLRVLKHIKKEAEAKTKG